MLNITEKVPGGLFLWAHNSSRHRGAPDPSDAAGKKQTQFHKMTQSVTGEGKGAALTAGKADFPQRQEVQGRLA